MHHDIAIDSCACEALAQADSQRSKCESSPLQWQLTCGQKEAALLGALDAARPAAAKGRAEGKVNVLLAVHADKE